APGDRGRQGREVLPHEVRLGGRLRGQVHRLQGQGAVDLSRPGRQGPEARGRVQQELGQREVGEVNNACESDSLGCTPPKQRERPNGRSRFRYPIRSRITTSQAGIVTQEITVVQKTLSAASSVSPPTSRTSSSVLTAVGTPAVRTSDAAGQACASHRSSGFQPSR